MALKRYFGLAIEDTFANTTVASKYIETVAHLPPDQGVIIPDPICDPSHSKWNLGPYRIKGNVGPYDVTPDNIGEMINAVMGNNGYANNPAGTHLWTCGADLDSYTLRIGAEIEERILSGMVANRLAIKASHGENLQATVEWVGPGIAETTGELTSLTRANLSSLQPFVYNEAAGNISLGNGDKSANVYDFEVEIDNSVPFERGNLNTRYMPKIRRGSRKVTGTISAYFDDDDEYDRFIAGNALDLTFKFYRSATAILQIKLPSCVYLRDASHKIQPMDEPLVIDAPFQAFYDESYTECQVSLTNNETGSYT